MKVITIANRKGGTGKTITTFNLAHSKASEGYRVLVIDLDSQGNLTKACNNNFIEFDDFMNVKTKNVTENLDILSSCKNQREVEKYIENNCIVPTSFLEQNIIPKINGYDYIFIDTSPAVHILNTNAFLVSDVIVIVIMLDLFSMLGMQDMYDIVNQVKKIKPNLEYKIVCNGYFKNRVLNKSIETNLETLDGFTGIYIPHRQQIKQDIAMYKPSIDSVKEYKLLSECL